MTVSKKVVVFQELVEDFIFPASKIVVQCRKLNDFPSEQAVPVCTTAATVTAAFDLLVSLCTRCVKNLKCLANMLIDMFYTGQYKLSPHD